MYQRKQAKKAVAAKLPSPPKSCLKYKEVQPVIDTGPNVRKRQEALDLIRQYYHVRPDELFRRIKVGTLVTLMVEVARLQLESASKQQSPAAAAGHKPTTDLQSLVQGTGELTLSAGDAPAPPPPPPSVDDQPYLLLDVREPEAFARDHMVTARHYPAARLARTMSYETAEMWCYKRHSHTVVVVCDEDEMLAQKCATTLAQRGYDNVFILSGGLRMARKKFPYGLLTSGDKERFTAPDLEALSTALEEFSVNAESPSGAPSIHSSRSVCSTALRATRPRADMASSTGPRWKL